MLRRLLHTRYLFIPKYLLATRLYHPQSQQVQPKQITLEHIQSSKSLADLITNINVFKINEHPHFRHFIRKLAVLINNKQLSQNQMALTKHLENIVYEIRRFSSAQLHANSSDILNYVLLFKKIKDHYQDRYSIQGFEYRASIVAETMPKMASLYNNDPLAMGLLHYTSTLFNLSKVQLKKNICNYIIRYFIMNASKKSDIDIDFCLCVLSASQYTPIKISIQSQIYEVMDQNINKRWYQIRGKLLMDKLISNRQLYGRAMKSPIGEKLKYNQLVNNNCINTKQNFVKIADLFISLLELQYKYLQQTEQPNYFVSKQLCEYFIMIFMLSQNMEISVDAGESRKFVNQNQQSEKQVEKVKNNTNNKNTNIQVIPLWKIASKIMQSVSLRKIYLKKQKKLVSIIVGELLNFYNTTDANRSLKIKMNKTVRLYSDQILTILIYCPKSIMQELKSSKYLQIEESQQKSTNIIQEVLKQCFKKLDRPEKNTITPPINTPTNKLLQSLTKLYRTQFKLLTQSQWKKIFKLIIKQDTQLQYWQVYFLLAETQQEELMKLIPFEEIMQKIRKDKFVISEKYKKNEHKNIQGSQQSYEKQSEEERVARRNRIIQFHSWQIYLLKAHALSLLLAKDTETGSSTPNIQMFQSQQFKNIFNKWLKPYSKYLLADLEQTYINKQALSEEFRFQQYQHRNKPLPFIQRYYKIIFDDTQCYKQYKLIKIILLQNKQVSDWLLRNQVYKQINFFAYYGILILGLGDRENYKEYMKAYDLENHILSIDLRKTTLFNGMKMRMFSLIKYQEQWQYIMGVLQKAESVHQSRDFICLWNDQQKTQQYLLQNNTNNQQYQCYKKCQLVIIKYLILDLYNQNNYQSSNDRRYVFLLNYISDISKNLAQNNDVKLQQFLPQKYLEQIKNVPLRMSLNSHRETSIAIGKMDQLSFLDKQSAQAIFTKLQFREKQLGYHLLKSHWLEYGSVEYQENVKIVNQMFYVPNAGFYKLIILIRFMDREKYQLLKNIIKTYYHQENKIKLISQLNIMKSKMGIVDDEQLELRQQNIKEQMNFEEQQVEEQESKDIKRDTSSSVFNMKKNNKNINYQTLEQSNAKKMMGRQKVINNTKDKKGLFNKANKNKGSS